MTGAIFAQHVGRYAAAGLPVFPVDTRHKRPAVKGWQGATLDKAWTWANVPELAKASGLGIVMGKPSRLVEVDVDAVSDAWLAIAVERYGETPVTIRTASGKSKLWYRHNGEGRHIRPIKRHPIDILGAGFTIAPPSRREDLGAAYRFLSGGLDDLPDLPTIKPQESFTCAAQGVREGQRNDALFRFCMTEARRCDDLAALMDVAATWAQAFPDPLSAREIDACARSAWKYETEGRNYLGLRKPQLIEGDRIMDELLDCPEAYTLLQMFIRWHGPRKSFAIAPTAMSQSGSPGWPRGRIERARDVLLERGFIEELKAPRQGANPGFYRLLQKQERERGVL